MNKASYCGSTQCRICGNRELEPVLSLGTQCLTGVFPAARDAQVPSGPLTLTKCAEDGSGSSCGLLQLEHTFDLDTMYRSSYGYRSGINELMVAHLTGVVERLLALVHLDPGDVVLDIGSNDCTLLNAYARRDCVYVGIDPAGETFREFYPANVQLVPDFFSAAAFRGAVGRRKAKVITSIAMFYDLPNPQTFVFDIRDILADDGIWVLELSYMPRMLELTAYDTVCHEHLEYYGLRQIKWMTDRADMKIIDVDMTETNGGSFCVTVAHAKSPYPTRSDRVETLIAREHTQGLATLAPYHRFAQDVARHGEALRDRLRVLHQSGALVLGYGASTKGNVLLQFCGITQKDIPAIADRNARKYGCFTPGTRIPIISEQEARDLHPNWFLVLPWHFRELFLRRERAFLDAGGRFLFPLPTIEELGV